MIPSTTPAWDPQYNIPSHLMSIQLYQLHQDVDRVYMLLCPSIITRRSISIYLHYTQIHTDLCQFTLTLTTLSESIYVTEEYSDLNIFPAKWGQGCELRYGEAVVGS